MTEFKIKSDSPRMGPKGQNFTESREVFTVMFLCAGGPPKSQQPKQVLLRGSGSGKRKQAAEMDQSRSPQDFYNYVPGMSYCGFFQSEV